MPKTTKSERDAWAVRVRGWERSGQSAREYGESVGVSARQLWRWSAKLGSATHVPPTRAAKLAPRFVEVGAAPSASVLEVVFEGVIVRIGGAVDVERVADLVRALGKGR